MITEFKLVGLSQPGSAILEFLDSDKSTFWATIRMTEDRRKALFDYFKNSPSSWKNNNIAVVQHDGYFEDGTPKDAELIEVKL